MCLVNLRTAAISNGKAVTTSTRRKPESSAFAKTSFGSSNFIQQLTSRSRWALRGCKNWQRNAERFHKQKLVSRIFSGIGGVCRQFINRGNGFEGGSNTPTPAA